MDAREDIAPSPNHLRWVVAVCLAVGFLCIMNTASAAGSLVDPSVVASSVAGKPLTVAVDSFGSGTWAGAAFVGGSEVFLGQAAYGDAERGGGVGLFLLFHETGHATGISDEHAADCFSLAHIKSALRRFWQLPAEQINERYRDALAWPGKYAGNRCTEATRRESFSGARLRRTAGREPE